MNQLQQVFIETVQKHTANIATVEKMWAEIIRRYANKKRHYHTLAHLENVYNLVNLVKADIHDWDAVIFALFYHDVVYNTLKHDNEEKSALLAAQRLAAIKIPVDTIAKCNSLILATKTHGKSVDTDINIFTDADLSILGSQPDVYKTYCQQVRQEYSIYPDLFYKPGRKKVLEHFLAMDQIFKTAVFFQAFEKQARENIKVELDALI